MPEKDVVRELVDAHGLDENVYKRASQLVDEFFARYEKPRRGRWIKYEGIAAAAVYLAALEAGRMVPHYALAYEAGISPSTLRVSVHRIVTVVLKKEKKPLEKALGGEK